MGSTIQLTGLIVGKLTEHKAYNLKKVCESYGLIPSSELNPMHSIMSPRN